MLQSFDVPAKGAQITAQGNYFRLEVVSAAGADESVRVRADGQDLGFYLPGDSITLPVSAVLWEVVPVTQTATAEVRIGVAGVQSSRMFGNVRVIDQGADKTLSGSQFMCSMTGVDATFRVLTLRASATKSVVIKRLVVTSSGAGSLAIGTGTGTPTSGYTMQGTARNKASGGPASTATREVALAAASTPTPGEVPGYLGLFTVLCNANAPVEIPLTTPLILAPGTLLVVTAPVAGAVINYIADFEEL